MIIIEVTEEDIKSGRRHSYSKCPIALAIRRAFARDYGVAVGVGSFCVGIDVWKLSRRAQNFIQNFDEGCPVKPFSFRIWKGKQA